MDPVAAYMMVVLSCNPGYDTCLELVQERRYFNTLADCETAIPSAIGRLDRPDNQILGRCATSEDQTDALGSHLESETTTIRVTRFDGTKTVIEALQVPRAP